MLSQLLCSGVSMRRCAFLLRIHRVTVARKLRFLGVNARFENVFFLEKTYPGQMLASVQFDEMETFEHSKCKPLSLALAVDSKTRRILSVQVSQMPSTGRLAAVSRKKYGYRVDYRRNGLEKIFRILQWVARPDVLLKSDECPRYPKIVKRHFPMAKHFRTIGGRGCIVGQGELKKLKFDPIFSLNHTAAMIRANVSRLVRRTWCTTKSRQALEDHLAIYVNFHNQVLTRD